MGCRERKTLTFKEILEAVDWHAVGTAQRFEAVLSDAEHETVTEAILSAVEKWTPGDFGRIGSVEEKFQAQIYPEKAVINWGQELFSEDPESVVGFVDLTVWPPSTVVDWKTTGDVGTKWQDRHYLSWQGPLYALAAGAQGYVYRGVERSPYRRVNGRGIHRTREVASPWPNFRNNQSVLLWLRQNLAQRAVLDGQSPWPQRSPGACGAFGRPCDFLELCETGTTPLTSLTLGPFSHSGIERFGLCPERYRLEKLLGEGHDEGAFGTAFHAGVAEVYGQLKKLQ